VTDNAFVSFFSEKNLHLPFIVWMLKATDLQKNNYATAQPVISGSKIYSLLLALPPLAEQARIVAKVDQLMALCDSLETKLARAGTNSETLITASIRNLIAA
jgi:type I restriction enzyme S subunit